MSSLTAPIDSGEPAGAERSDPALLRALADPATYGLRGTVSVHETHASWVFVCAERAYKVKKPVALGFLDYSTLARRRAACLEEVRVNRELAPGIYLGVRAVVATANGPRLGNERDPAAVEYLVEMLAFSERDTLAGLIAAGALRREHLVAVARRLADFHRHAPRVPGGGSREVLAAWRENLRELSHEADRLAPELAPSDADGFAEAFVQAHRDEIERRRMAGLIRDGHGDLRCEHVLATPSVRVVDRVEFDPALRHTDVACDLAFLTMDLEAHGQRWAARELVDAYRRSGIDPGSDELLAFYGAHRALVRAKVALLAAGEAAPQARAAKVERAAEMSGLAERLRWRARAPLAVVICGPPASGKSTLAAELARRSGLAVLASDAVRKSAAGLGPRERGAPELYSEAATHATYERLGGEAARLLARERGVIVDATCRARGERATLLARLRRDGATPLVVRCRLPLALALERAERRMGDPGRVSDATPEVVAEHFGSFEELDELPAGEVLDLDSSRSLEAQVGEVARNVDLRLRERGR
jgi:aminoglycoside phosphotransferase family enzyme/predicted kinase